MRSVTFWPVVPSTLDAAACSALYLRRRSRHAPDCPRTSVAIAAETGIRRSASPMCAPSPRLATWTVSSGHVNFLNSTHALSIAAGHQSVP
eukprot:238562-Prymnesium_polylepis.3